ncbi:MAG: VUT family protein [Clostridia bacterium]|nr:VUT family protein [Clostridia bacterium]
MKKFFNLIKREAFEFKLLLRSIPSVVTALYVLSVVCMNLLANKEIQTNTPYLALDCGIIVSWLAFLTMDMLTKRFGPKASIEVSLFALFINLLMTVIFFAISKIPGNWGEFYTYGEDNINAALNTTLGGNWFVVLGSSIAFIASAIINSLLNYTIGKLTKKDNWVTFFIRSHVSTIISQFLDNLLFAVIVSMHLFGWTITQALMCSLTGAAVELLCEVIFTAFGYKVVRSWEKEKVGEEYIDYSRNLKLQKGLI